MSSTFIARPELEGSGTTSEAGRNRSGIVGRVLAAIARARAAQAQREIDRYLARQPDRLLRDMGIDEASIAALRGNYGH